jgi:hypothetical protein
MSVCVERDTLAGPVHVHRQLIRSLPGPSIKNRHSRKLVFMGQLRKKAKHGKKISGFCLWIA